jgi:hypothetical protein
MLGMSGAQTLGAIIFLALFAMLTICSVVSDWRRVQVAKHTGKSEPVGSNE